MERGERRDGEERTDEVGNGKKRGGREERRVEGRDEGGNGGEIKERYRRKRGRREKMRIGGEK